MADRNNVPSGSSYCPNPASQAGYISNPRRQPRAAGRADPRFRAGNTDPGFTAYHGVDWRRFRIDQVARPVPACESARSNHKPTQESSNPCWAAAVGWRLAKGCLLAPQSGHVSNACEPTRAVIEIRTVLLAPSLDASRTRQVGRCDLLSPKPCPPQPGARPRNMSYWT